MNFHRMLFPISNTQDSMVRDKIPAFLEFFSGWETGNQFIKTQIMSGSKCYGGIWISAVHRQGGQKQWVLDLVAREVLSAGMCEGGPE